MCQCDLCNRNDRIRNFIAEQPQSVQDFIIEMNEMLIHSEMDRDYYKAIVYGQWPDSDELIQTARKITAHKSKQEKQNDTTVHSTSKS